MGYGDDFNDMEDLLHTFTTEGQELLDEVEPRLIELKEKSEESGQVDEEVLNSIFRIFHTIKGSAGFLELNSLQEVTHEAETILDYYRKGRLVPSGDQISILLSTTDFIRKLLGNIEKYLHDRGFEPEAHLLVEALARMSAQSAGQCRKQDAPERTAAAQKPDQAVQTPDDPENEFLLVINSEMIEQYSRESLDILDGLEQTLIDLENDPDNHELIDLAFRNLHTIKGNSGLLGLGDLERLSHKTESFFDHLRKGTIRIEMETVKMLLSIMDLLRSTVKEMSSGGKGTVRGCDVLIGFMDEVITEELVKRGSPGDTAAVVTQAPDTPPTESFPQFTGKISEIPQPDLLDPDTTDSEPETPLLSSSPQRQSPSKEILSERPARSGEQAASLSARKDIRVDLEKVDKLVDLVGELALAEMMVVQNPALVGLDSEDFERAAHHLDRIISELQYVSMSLRMVPIAPTFRKLIRLVHDLSHKSSKSVKLITLGEETEVDKTVVDHIADPLVHIVRNAIDHGIELPEDRKSAGKNESGTVTIDAKHEGGEVWIEISDDGRGLSREKILRKARQMGLVSGEGSELKDEDVYKLILEPGFSTAEKITEVSGRGVGMDVVKRNLEKINGQVDILSTPGKGSRFTLRIPLTLALMDGMLVQVGKTRYVVPLLSIRECIRPLRKDITHTPDGQEIVKVRDELIPVARLHLLHHIVPENELLEEALLMVVEYRGKSYCIAVDAVLGQQQAVIKGLSEYVGNVRGASGCTILGDGTVSLILDVGSLLEMVFQDRGERALMG